MCRYAVGFVMYFVVFSAGFPYGQLNGVAPYTYNAGVPSMVKKTDLSDVSS